MFSLPPPPQPEPKPMSRLMMRRHRKMQGALLEAAAQASEPDLGQLTLSNANDSDVEGDAGIDPPSEGPSVAPGPSSSAGRAPQAELTPPPTAAPEPRDRSSLHEERDRPHASGSMRGRAHLPPESGRPVPTRQRSAPEGPVIVTFDQVAPQLYTAWPPRDLAMAAAPASAPGPYQAYHLAQPFVPMSTPAAPVAPITERDAPRDKPDRDRAQDRAPYRSQPQPQHAPPTPRGAAAYYPPPSYPSPPFYMAPPGPAPPARVPFPAAPAPTYVPVPMQMLAPGMAVPLVPVHVQTQHGPTVMYAPWGSLYPGVPHAGSHVQPPVTSGGPAAGPSAAPSFGRTQARPRRASHSGRLGKGREGPGKHPSSHPDG